MTEGSQAAKKSDLTTLLYPLSENKLLSLERAAVTKSRLQPETTEVVGCAAQSLLGAPLVKITNRRQKQIFKEEMEEKESKKKYQIQVD